VHRFRGMIGAVCACCKSQHFSSLTPQTVESSLGQDPCNSQWPCLRVSRADHWHSVTQCRLMSPSGGASAAARLCGGDTAVAWRRWAGLTTGICSNFSCYGRYGNKAMSIKHSTSTRDEQLRPAFGCGRAALAGIGSAGWREAGVLALEASNSGTRSSNTNCPPAPPAVASATDAADPTIGCITDTAGERSRADFSSCER
jgi:hypothetical protein